MQGGTVVGARAGDRHGAVLEQQWKQRCMTVLAGYVQRRERGFMCGVVRRHGLEHGPHNGNASSFRCIVQQRVACATV